MSPTLSAGPAGLPLVGHLPAYLRDRLGFLVRCAAEYGDVVRLRIGTPTLLLAGPDDIRHVLVTRQERYTKSLRISSRRARRALGTGLLTTGGDAHLRQRRLLQPLFHRRMIESFAATVVEAAADAASTWTGGTTLDMSRSMRALTQRVMIAALLGKDGQGAALARAVTQRRRYYEHLLSATWPWPEYQPSRSRLAHPSALAAIDAVLARALRARREPEASSADLLSMLCALRHADGTGMTDAQIRDEALTFMDTGYETVSAALGWTWLLLAQHPECQRRLAGEVRKVVGERAPSSADLPALRYTGMVLSEALRLYPPTWMFVRVAREDDTLPSGAAVAAGSKLLLCQYVAQRNPRHFPEPERFVPERFGEHADAGRPRFAYFPFGGGPHTCIGEPFARMECTLVLATIAQRYFVAPDPSQRVTLYPGPALRPRRGIRLRLSDAERSA
ncbi:MAG: cytochrome P450 [Vicinamibacteria bacterium]|nr:cytochrome P450 [Vicinamibacteria bacterium]